ncbi:MAG TPA: DUF202 domain-containing protein [Chromatiales bacterium]|nr:DUF202 domain-containing protein [Chromatiales bacterium]
MPVVLKGMEKYVALKELSARHGCGWIEYSEKISQPLPILLRLDMETMHDLGWFPAEIKDDRATVITCEPGPKVAADVKQRLGVKEVDFLVTLPEDLARIIEHNQGVNPASPFASGRTPLARVRTYLAGRRSLLAYYRTMFAKGRTGLALIRTGLACITIALLFLRVFGDGWFLFLEAPLLLAGCVMVFNGLRWYLPVRKFKNRVPPCEDTQATDGSTVLTAAEVKTYPVFTRSPEIPGARELRRQWTGLTPVMRRRFLASDRTDYAEERTVLACIRTQMAKTRTGLAFIRTGIAFASLGFGLIRYFHASNWLPFDLALMTIGVVMVLEGFLWYQSGRKAGNVKDAKAKWSFKATNIWESFSSHRCITIVPKSPPLPLPVRASDRPGIWATTGLALERTVLAERRNVMSRLRTVMAQERTGFAFIRTGRAFIFIGLAFALFFGPGVTGWNILNWTMVAIGLFFVGDGLRWALPAGRTRRQFPYCFDEMEITIPDYGVPARFWRTIVLNHE